jgi:hypothetical protein
MPFTIDIPESRNSRAHASAYTSFEERGGLAELSGFYRQLGFEAGYAQAARDQLELSVVTAEQILREQNALTGPTDARRLLYAFIARLDRKLSLFSDSSLVKDAADSDEAEDDRKNEDCNEGYMEGGLGI